MNTSVTETAYAKINLSLDVTGKLENGYHTLRMIMESVSIHDDLKIDISDRPGIRLSCVTEGRALSVAALDCGDDNLIIRAAKKLSEAVNPHGAKNKEFPGLDMHLTKRIPMAAGLAGGSSDAAAALRGLNRLLGLGLTTDELCDIGVKIGADVPYCIRGGSYLAEGIGDILTPLPAPPEAYLLLAKPNVDVSTAYVYKKTDEAKTTVHPDTDGMINALEKGDLKKICSCLGNVLRDVTIPEHPEVSELESAMISAGAAGALMSGSGPTVYGIFEDEDLLDNACSVIQRTHPGIFISKAAFASYE